MSPSKSDTRRRFIGELLEYARQYKPGVSGSRDARDAKAIGHRARALAILTKSKSFARTICDAHGKLPRVLYLSHENAVKAIHQWWKDKSNWPKEDLLELSEKLEQQAERLKRVVKKDDEMFDELAGTICEEQGQCSINNRPTNQRQLPKIIVREDPELEQLRLLNTRLMERLEGNDRLMDELDKSQAKINLLSKEGILILDRLELCMAEHNDLTVRLFECQTALAKCRDPDRIKGLFEEMLNKNPIMTRLWEQVNKLQHTKHMDHWDLDAVKNLIVSVGAMPTVPQCVRDCNDQCPQERDEPEKCQNCKMMKDIVDTVLKCCLCDDASAAVDMNKIRQEFSSSRDSSGSRDFSSSQDSNTTRIQDNTFLARSSMPKQDQVSKLQNDIDSIIPDVQDYSTLRQSNREQYYPRSGNVDSMMKNIRDRSTNTEPPIRNVGDREQYYPRSGNVGSMMQDIRDREPYYPDRYNAQSPPKNADKNIFGRLSDRFMGDRPKEPYVPYVPKKYYVHFNMYGCNSYWPKQDLFDENTKISDLKARAEREASEFISKLKDASNNVTGKSYNLYIGNPDANIVVPFDVQTKSGITIKDLMKRYNRDTFLVYKYEVTCANNNGDRYVSPRQSGGPGPSGQSGGPGPSGQKDPSVPPTNKQSIPTGMTSADGDLPPNGDALDAGLGSVSEGKLPVYMYYIDNEGKNQEIDYGSQPASVKLEDLKNTLNTMVVSKTGKQCTPIIMKVYGNQESSKGEVIYNNGNVENILTIGDVMKQFPAATSLRLRCYQISNSDTSSNKDDDEDDESTEPDFNGEEVETDTTFHASDGSVGQQNPSAKVPTAFVKFYVDGVTKRIPRDGEIKLTMTLDDLKSDMQQIVKSNNGDQQNCEFIITDNDNVVIEDANMSISDVLREYPNIKSLKFECPNDLSSSTSDFVGEDFDNNPQSKGMSSASVGSVGQQNFGDTEDDDTFESEGKGKSGSLSGSQFQKSKSSSNPRAVNPSSSSGGISFWQGPLPNSSFSSLGTHVGTAPYQGLNTPSQPSRVMHVPLSETVLKQENADDKKKSK